MPLHSPTRSRRRRLASTLATVAAATLIVTGCAGSPEKEEPLGSQATGVIGQADEGAFPTTIKHVYGETTITEEPKRVVTIGWSAQDAVAALGVTPVGVPEYIWGGDEDGYLPWFADRVEELGGTLPEKLNNGSNGEIDFEQMLALDPDVILAPHSGLTETDYERLSTIAPTVAFDKTAWASEWDRLTLTVGQALGRTSTAEALVSTTNTQMEIQGSAHPEFAGKTFVYGTSLSEGDSDLGVYAPSDPRIQIVEQLGLTLAPGVAENTTPDGGFSQAVSLEDLDRLDADLFIFWGSETAEEQATLGNALMARWRPVAENHALFLSDKSLVMATSAPSALSIPWSLDTFVPALADMINR
ncbi:iron-siderophore ABC transporter substrate-binding protein [Mycetocola spongiae]|uniref:iron-siderophore ABC transporter substrate-binding protein n=1 Tax=Mycetocola spongiae TaxID=2859226 RepID=UPI001CF4EE2C|nr:iron-siderophore ABC transporter substrate-binding protein [Mycetocola spongiae]UCR89385.1 iron-siderophore ABC transporter substrate-binding protein [Mycetocola spongiae]